jgi:hypothetical protein
MFVIFKTSIRDFASIDRSILDSILNYVPKTITEQDNNMLMASFGKEEFSMDLFQMNSDKSPWPRWFQPVFLQEILRN